MFYCNHCQEKLKSLNKKEKEEINASLSCTVFVFPFLAALDKLCNHVTLFLPLLYGAAKPKLLEIQYLVMKQTVLHRFRQFQMSTHIKMASSTQKVQEGSAITGAAPYFQQSRAKPGVFSTNTFVTDWLAHSSFVKIYLWRRHACLVEDGAFSHKIDYLSILQEILNLKGHPNSITHSIF